MAAAALLFLLAAGCGGGKAGGRDAPGAAGAAGAAADGGRAAAAPGRPLTEEEMVRYGKSMFRPMCASCHGANGEGGTAAALNRPDLLKKYPTREALARRIAEGDQAAGMPACAAGLEKAQLDSLAAYVASLAR